MITVQDIKNYIEKRFQELESKEENEKRIDELKKIEQFVEGKEEKE